MGRMVRLRVNSLLLNRALKVRRLGLIGIRIRIQIP